MIRALLVEDEDLAAQRLAKLVTKVDAQVQVVARTTSIKETVRYLSENTLDLMFLDINLSDGFSFSIFEEDGFKTPPIIFTTAYSEYAIRAFELNSISYLLKPINEEALTSALKKFRHLTGDTNADGSEDGIDYEKLMQDFLKPYKERFLVKINNRIETINIADIKYFYTEDKLSFMMLRSGRHLPIEKSLKQLEKEIDPKDFYRINRKYIIHHSSIKTMYYTSKSRIKVELDPPNENDGELNFVAIEKVGRLKKWLDK